MIYASGSDKGDMSGWMSIKEVDSSRVALSTTDPYGGGLVLVMTRGEARSFAAHIMNVANR